MKNVVTSNRSLLILLLSCVIALPAVAADRFLGADADAFDASNIDAIGDAVADWQIAHLDKLAGYVPNIRSNTTDRRGWVHGAFYVGLVKWASLPGNGGYFDTLRQIAEENGWKLGDRLFHADDHVVGQLYLDFYAREQDSGMIDHTIRQFNQILVADPDGSLEFAGDDIRGVGRACQLRWCWCDALFMSPPTWMMLTLATGDGQYLEFADREFWATTAFLKDTEYSLYYRDSRYFERRGEDGEKIFWSRGNGWVYAGLVNILRILPADHPSYPKYFQLYIDMSKTIAGLQHDNGLWSPSLLGEDAIPETSGSGFMTYGLAWGVNNGYLDQETYGPVVKQAWQALAGAVADDGRLGWVQPIGAAPDSVVETDSQLYGVGAFLLAASQVMAAD